MVLAALFTFFAICGLSLAMLGHAAHTNSVAPSMSTNNISPVGYAIFAMCGLIALACYASFKGIV